MFAIYKRELKSYFCSFIGLLFIAVTLCFIGFFFTVYNLLQAYPFLAYALSSCSFMYMITVPILTMRILAEERKSKTDQLILTAPVSVGGIVMGKFLALVTIYAIPMAVCCIYPLLLQHYGAMTLAENYIAILAFFLYGVTSIAVGLLISSVTESQVIAAVLSFVILFASQMVDTICTVISSTGNLLTKILRCLDIYTPFTEMINGTLNLASVVYYVSVTAAILFLTVQSIQKRRYSVSVKNFSLSAYSSGMIAVVIGIVVLLNFIVGEMPTSWKTVDLTDTKLYSLTEQSKEFAKNVQEDVTIYVLADEEQQDTLIGHTVQAFDDLSDYITVQYVNPAVNPQFYTKYTTGYLSSNSVIVESAKRYRVINYDSMYEVTYSSDYSTSTETGYDGEGRIISALDYVTNENMSKIYLTQGHDELTLGTTFTNAVVKENVEYEYITLADYDAVPEDTDCLFINAAITDFSAVDAEKVIQYLDKGGKVILVLGYTMEELPNIESIAAYMGLSVVDGFVMELNENNYFSVPYYLFPDQYDSDYTNGTFGSLSVFTPYSKGILIDEDAAEDMSYQTFLATSSMAFSKVNLEATESYEKSEGDIDGPFAVGIEAVKTLEEGEALMVVIGCENMFTDDANNMVSDANLTVFSNTICKLVGRESSISIPVKTYAANYVMITQGTAVLIGGLVTIVLPIACLVLGFVIWFRRRKR